jgi:hypothetical protein
MKRIREANADDSALEDNYYMYEFSEGTFKAIPITGLGGL